MSDEYSEKLKNEAVSDVPAPPKGRRRFRTCIVHIGTEKTGTTALQHLFEINRKTLKDAGIFYPQFNEAGSQWEFVAAAHDAPWQNVDLKRVFNLADQEAQEAYQRELSARLEKQFSKAGKCSTLLISSEHLHSRLHSETSIERLKSFLGSWADSFKVVVYFRRQDRVALSLYSTRIKSGLVQDDPIFPYGRAGAPRYYYYDDIFERWANVFGAENVHAKVYEEASASEQGLLTDFLALLGITADGMTFPRRTINASLSREAIYFLEELNRQAPRYVDDQEDPDVERITRDISELFPGKHYPVSRKQAAHFARFFHKRNERLRTLAFPDRTTPLFDDDFSEYPEEADPTGLTAEEAVEIALNLQRHERRRSDATSIWQLIVQRWLKWR